MSQGPARPVQHTKPLDWAVATRPYLGETVSGDDCVVIPVRDGVLLAVVDGLGHGQYAAEAAHAALDSVSIFPELPIEDIMAQCHAKIRGTRGVAMTIARISSTRKTVQWCGVGNVECFLLSLTRGTRESAPLRGGVVGYQLPTVRSATHPIAMGDTLVFATDGVRADFADQFPHLETLEQIAGQIIIRHAKSSDDALVLVARINEGDG